VRLIECCKIPKEEAHAMHLHLLLCVRSAGALVQQDNGDAAAVAMPFRSCMVVVVVWVGGCELSCGWGELGDGGRKGRRKKVVLFIASHTRSTPPPHFSPFSAKLAINKAE
jgi:hypothetical protein